MRYLFGFLCVCALGLMPLVGCSETAGDGGSGGTAGDGGSGGSNSAVFPCTEQGILDAIAEGGGPHTFDCNGQTTVTTNAEIVIDNDVILDGEGNLTVDGDEGHPVFQVGNVTAELHGFTVTGGVSDSGGGIMNGGGTLTVTNSTVSGNTNGGIHNSGTLTLTNSTVSGNTDGGGGGGIWNGGTLTVTNSTVSGNTGYGINTSGTLTITNSTVSGNTGGGIQSVTDVDTVTLTNALIDGNCAIKNISVLVSNGYNIESPGDTCGFDHGTDLVNITEGQLELGPLADNGGDTMTHALGAGSVAIDHIPAVDCEVDEDQRGQPRPETDGGMCDVGSFEVQGPIKSGLWLGGSPASNTDGSPFDTGWAICFYVNEDGTALTPSTDCDIDGDDDEAYVLELSWKNDVGGGTVQGEVGVCNANPEEGSESIGIGDSYPFEDAFGVGAVGVPIEDSSFAIPLGALLPEVAITGGEIIGTFNGDTASGTATWTWSPGMGYSQCELDGGWAAAPAP